MPKKRFSLPMTVIGLGIVSFLSDVSSDMVFPLIPLFLSTVLHAGPVALGAIEGMAEATASLLKVVSGVWADRVRRRMPMVAVGYTLAAIARPLIGVATIWPQVLGLRFMDRVGKGVRESPRDALIADVVPPEQHGVAYGFQRALDNGGAMVGPLIAAALLHWAGMELRTVFLLAAIPGVLSVIVVLASVRDKPSTAAPKPRTSLVAGWKELGPGYKTYLVALLVFTLGGSTDAFLLLQLGKAGLSGSAIAVTWAMFHAVKTVVSLAGGRMTDRFGPRVLMIGGWFFYAAVYVAFSYALPPAVLIAVFIVYGAYYGLTEPAERAWVTHLVPTDRVGTGFGIFHGVIGLTALPASLLFGLLWQAYGSQVAFLTGAGLALAGAVLLTRVPVRA